MLTADKIIKEIYLLPLAEREKIARHIVNFGIRASSMEKAQPLDLQAWQDEIAEKPFNLRQASEYIGISQVTLRRWIKAGRVPAYKAGRAYTFDVHALKRFKKEHMTA